MKVIVCGAGQVGGQICRYLQNFEFDLTAIDHDGGIVRRLADTLDITGITGSAADPSVLETAGVEDAALVVAATSSDEINISCCLVARCLNSKARTIARLKNQAYHEVVTRESGGPVDIAINPEAEVASVIQDLLEAPSIFDRRNVFSSNAMLIGIKLRTDCPVLNTPLRQLSELYPTLRTVVVGLRRHGTFSIPTPLDQLFANDEVYLFLASGDLDRTLKIFNKECQPCVRILIVGVGSVGLCVAEQLERSSHRTNVKVIEFERSRAEWVAGKLRKTVVLHGDGLDIDLLDEAGIRGADAIISVTDDEKTNLLVSARAKKANSGIFALSLVDQPSLMALMEPLKIDSVVNPRALTVTSILPHVRGLKYIQGLRAGFIYSVGDGEAEIVEAKIIGPSPVTGKRIRNAGLPEGSLVGALEKNGEPVKVTPDTKIEIGDRIAIFAHIGAVRHLMELLSSDAR